MGKLHKSLSSHTVILALQSINTQHSCLPASIAVTLVVVIPHLRGNCSIGYEPGLLRHQVLLLFVYLTFESESDLSSESEQLRKHSEQESLAHLGIRDTQRNQLPSTLQKKLRQTCRNKTQHQNTKRQRKKLCTSYKSRKAFSRSS